MNNSNNTLCNAVPHDFDIIITVCPGLLVPETQRMKELMFNGGNVVTVCSYRQSLLPNMPVANRGETAYGKKMRLL